MAITINGTGSITGISAGGLPDGSITNDDLAGSITDAKLSGTTCKAWVNFNGTGTPAIRASYNVSSITDNGTGNYRVNFTTALTDANYAITTADDAWGRSLVDSVTASNYVVKILNNSDAALDTSYVLSAIFR
jgi:hypothetical protein